MGRVRRCRSRPNQPWAHTNTLPQPARKKERNVPGWLQHSPRQAAAETKLYPRGASRWRRDPRHAVIIPMPLPISERAHHCTLRLAEVLPTKPTSRTLGAWMRARQGGATEALILCTQRCATCKTSTLGTTRILRFLPCRPYFPVSRLIVPASQPEKRISIPRWLPIRLARLACRGIGIKLHYSLTLNSGAGFLFLRPSDPPPFLTACLKRVAFLRRRRRTPDPTPRGLQAAPSQPV